MLAKLPSVCKELLSASKSRFWSSRRLLVNISVENIEISKYDRAELQITISFGLQSATKILKIGLQSAIMGMQSVTCLDYKLRWDYKARGITRWYSTHFSPLIARLQQAIWATSFELLFWFSLVTSFLFT